MIEFPSLTNLILHLTYRERSHYFSKSHILKGIRWLKKIVTKKNRDKFLHRLFLKEADHEIEL